MDYLDLMERRISGSEKNVPSRLGNKKLVRDFCDLIGVKTPEILQINSIDKVDVAKLPTNFVLKPSFGSTSIGVKLLKKTDTDFLDLLTETVLTWDQIQSESLAVAEKWAKDPHATFIIEQLLMDNQGNVPPDDIRFYCFQGEVGLIVKEDHMKDNIVKAMYFDGDFLPFDDLENRYSVAEQAKHLESIVEAVVPDKWQELLNVAKRISCAVPTAFARIDLYDTPEGIYLGEITLTPGTFYYKNRKVMSLRERHRLGRMWIEAEKRMLGSKGFDL